MRNFYNNRIIQFMLVLAAGLLIGWFIFGGSPDNDKTYSASDTEDAVWTCSMHPQIRQSEPGKCPLCGMDLIPLRTGSGSRSDNPFVHTMTPEAAAMANIQTTAVSSGAPQYEINLTGRIAADEQKLSVITASYTGRIEKLFVNFTGQSVRKGDKLASVYSPELITAQRELIEAKKSQHLNPSLYNAVREKLRLLKITAAQMDAIENSGEVVSELDIYADVSGVVITRNVSSGDYVNRGSVLFEIADLSTVWVIFNAYESDLPLIKEGSTLNFSVVSVPGREFSSKVTFIDRVIDPGTRTAAVRAETLNPGLVLKPDMFVRGTIKSSVSVKDKSLTIPKTALLWTGPRSVVYVKIPGSEFPEFEMREVVLGAGAGDHYVIEKGLEEGEQVVTNGVFAVDAAAQLNGSYSMMNRPVSIRIEVPEAFKAQLTNSAEIYFNLKDALVNDDSKTASSVAVKLLQSLKNISISSLSSEAQKKWKEQADHLTHSAAVISKAAAIEEQRESFEMMSDAMIVISEVFGLNIPFVYVQFCPMAFDDKGAYWLSKSGDIKNPYFGEEMLECGEVKRKISSVDSYKQNSIQPVQQEAHQH